MVAQVDRVAEVESGISYFDIISIVQPYWVQRY